MLTSLVAHPKGLAFGDLKQMCGLTDGNLSRHLQVLEEAGLVDIEKGYDRNRPKTVVRITAQGRTRYLDYLTCSSRSCPTRRTPQKRARRPLPSAQAGMTRPDFFFLRGDFVMQSIAG